MAGQLHMAVEVRAWLNDLRLADPAQGRLAAEAVLALLDEGSGLGAPLLVAAGGPARADDPLERLDQSHQDQLELLAKVRRGIADIATTRKRLDIQMTALEQQASKLAVQRDKAAESGRDDLARESSARRSAVQAQHARIRAQYADVLRDEEQLTVAMRRLQAKVVSFRTRKETVKATYTAARAGRALGAEVAELTALGDQEAAVEAAEAQAGPAVSALSQVVQGLLDSSVEHGAPRPPAPPPEPGTLPGLMELRPGAPAGSGLRILLAFTPAGDAVLLAGGQAHGGVAVTGAPWYQQAGPAAQARLRSLAQTSPRAAGDGLVTSFSSYDRKSFLREFCPDDAAQVRAGAAALTARNRARPVAELRSRIGLTQAELAERMRVPPDQVAGIEEAEPGAIEVAALAAYVAALGGRLELIADFGADQVVLPTPPGQAAPS